MVAPVSIFAPVGGAQDGMAVARRQAEELEGVFLNTLMKEMFSKSASSESGFGGGFAEETWRSMQSEQYAAAMAASGGIGLADRLASDLFALQQISSEGVSP